MNKIINEENMLRQILHGDGPWWSGGGPGAELPLGKYSDWVGFESQGWDGLWISYGKGCRFLG